MHRVLAIATLVAIPAWAAAEPDRWTLDLEGGWVSTRYNTAQVPKATGSKIDLGRLLGRKAQPTYRVALSYRDHHDGEWKLMIAPLRRATSGTLTGPAKFAGQSFAAGNVNGLYQFNSYRLTYRKPWRSGWSVGGTLKVRDAEIRLSQGATGASEKNVGFVPLLHVHKTGTLARGLNYELEVDGLAGGPGRAVDATFRLTRPLNAKSEAFVGVRILEGGADVPKVRNFAWLNYVTAGVTLRF